MCRPTCGWLCQCVPACVWSECVDFCLGNWTAEASFLIKIWLCYSSCLCHLQHHPSPSPLVSSSSQNVCLPCVLITTEVWYQITVIHVVGIEFSEWSYPNISDRTWSFGCMEIPSAQLPSCWDNPTRGAALSRCAVISAHEKCVTWQCFVLRWYRTVEIEKMRKCWMMCRSALLTLAEWVLHWFYQKTFEVKYFAWVLGSPVVVSASDEHCLPCVNIGIAVFHRGTESFNLLWCASGLL